MKPILALTLSTQRAQVALLVPGLSKDASPAELFRENTEPRKHSEWLLTAVSELLSESNMKLADLEGIALDIGPGSFTGIRVGFHCAQSFAYAHGLPCFAKNSLEILSYGRGQDGKPVFAAMNAFRNLIYFMDSRTRTPEVLTFDEAAKRIFPSKNAVLVGDAFEKLPEFKNLLSDPSLTLELPLGSEFPQALTLAKMASLATLEAAETQKSLWTKDWKSLSPLYLRGSEAEEKARLR